MRSRAILKLPPASKPPTHMAAAALVHAVSLHGMHQAQLGARGSALGWQRLGASARQQHIPQVQISQVQCGSPNHLHHHASAVTVQQLRRQCQENVISTMTLEAQK